MESTVWLYGERKLYMPDKRLPNQDIRGPVATWAATRSRHVPVQRRQRSIPGPSRDRGGQEGAVFPTETDHGTLPSVPGAGD